MLDTSLVAAMAIRFIIGGAAVLGSTLIARKLGGRIGGIFAAFPAVYLAALLTIRMDASGAELIDQSIMLSKGALVGMGINSFVALMAGVLCMKQGWKKGIALSVVCWLSVSMLIALFAQSYS
ncbi:hypothetical protein DNH61_05045 [Paenibacillus sambharensis]|uniref:DUF3147 domain-containing protein n=1 Tax=Paenibacillus sambharensis TaxID=1803190 RepID=A0A2W1LPV7_9BACL|nr:DUF3147 family protein [Paenibacillus sambharensis]PZD96885.1 hypothetical protein DNH61_05045 [Paenibacillus sambharensis]